MGFMRSAPGLVSLCLAGRTELGKPDRSCAISRRGHFQSGALKDSVPLRFLLDNLFPLDRVALWKPVCFRSVRECFLRTHLYLPTEPTL